ncbi:MULTISPECIES: hypothetical protein [Ruegeria]|uniref:hypothetical protein n=1 Tax=Ruegeria TaxID=97050 RepID=UPI00147A307E|nr:MULTISPECIES: hypothetical protein [Ruegeria]MBY6084188.1 hypothetical protein [Ruegeria arenilitoris]UWR09297.1 hypothetical protein K3752_18905 [Ruegeria sp. B32]
MTTRKALIGLCALSLIAACTETTSMSGDKAPGDLAKVPEGVVEIAAPGQDLTAVRIMPEDGCYWYRYVGPVETTYLPLRTADGRPICARA